MCFNGKRTLKRWNIPLPKEHYGFISSLSPACCFISEAGSPGPLPHRDKSLEHCLPGKPSETLKNAKLCTCAGDRERETHTDRQTDGEREGEREIVMEQKEPGRSGAGVEVSVTTVIPPVILPLSIKLIKLLSRSLEATAVSEIYPRLTAQRIHFPRIHALYSVD